LLKCQHWNAPTMVEGGAQFKTPALAPALAVECLRFHREDAHGQLGAAAGGGAKKVQLSKIPRPEISGGCSQEDFKFFTRKWDQYVRSSNEKYDNKLKDQLTNCPDDTLRSSREVWQDLQSLTVNTELDEEAAEYEEVAS
jgi:hypothetical protein